MAEDLISFLGRIPKVKLKDGQTLIKKTTYQGIALWWFVRLSPFIRIESIISSDKSPKIKNWQKLKGKICRSLRLMYDFLASILGKINTSLYKQNKEKKDFNNNKKILVTGVDTYWEELLDPNTEKPKKLDTFFYSIFAELLKNNYEIITTYPICIGPKRDFFRGLKTIIEKRMGQKMIIHKPFDNYWSWEIWKKEKLARTHFKKVWKDLKDDSTFKNLWKYDGRDLYGKILDDLACYFIQFFPQVVKYIEMAKRLLEQEKPDLILFESGQGEFGKALIVAGKLKDIPTLAIQHGSITPYNMGYMYTKDEISPNGNIKSPYCPIPNKTAVYGPYYKELLTKESAFPEDSIVVTGQPRYDILAKADKVYSKNRFLKRYKINPNHKIILWLTQCNGLSDEENIKNFKAVFRTIQNLKNVILIIKQHPGEEKAYTSMIKDHLNNYQINAIMTPKKSDTYEQLFACDLMVTKNSTTAMEAVALDKPVIVLNFDKDPDAVDYVKQGIACGVYKEEDLAPTIEKLLKDDLELAKNRQRFVEKYLYGIDGKATERVMKLIKEMINGNDFYGDKNKTN